MLEKAELFLRELKSFIWANQLSLDTYQLERLARFAALVDEKNKKINLISRKDIPNLIENHVFFSTYLTEFIPDKVSKFLDIGTGGGFPGIPLAIARPLMRGVLVDSTTKKIEAVHDFINNLKLSNAVAENCRVESEEFKSKYKDSFDMVISRGTVPLILLFRYSLPLIKERAYIIAVKGGNLETEFKTAELKYKAHIRKSTIFELPYKPTNERNIKKKRMILLEVTR